MASKQQTIDTDSPVTKVYKDYLKHLKKEHPEIYARYKDLYDWYRPPKAA